MSDLKSLKPNATECDSLDELLPLYAFGFSDQAESAEVERLLARCPHYADELHEYRALAERYLSSAPPVDPPPHLLINLLQATTPPSPVRRRAIWTTLAAALVIVLLALNVWILGQMGRMSEMVEGQSGLLADFVSEEVLTFNLVAPEDVPTSAKAVIHCNPQRKAAVIRAENFPPAEGYQVWLWRDGERDAAGTLDVDETGRGTSIFNAPNIMGAYQYVSIAPPVGTEPTPVVRGGLYPAP